MVKVFRPLGQYPKTVISTPEYLYSADNDLVFSVTKATPYDQLKGEMPYSEMDWLAPDELRLLGSILLCERRDDALIRFYPIYRYGPLLDKKRLDLSDPEVGERIKLLIQFEARTRALTTPPPIYTNALRCAITLLSPSDTTSTDKGCTGTKSRQRITCYFEGSALS